MTEKETVTVASVPVTVTVADRVLTVTIGRFDPAAAGGMLRIHPRFGTAAVGVYIAGENGDTAHRPGQRWFFELHPGPAETILLCDGCYQGGTGPVAGCEDDCPHKQPGRTGLCYRAGTGQCRWRGQEDRLREVRRADVEHLLPTAGEKGEGVWWLHVTDGRPGPCPSQQAARDHWHANCAGLRRDTPGTGTGTRA